jgi:hypothetical protein
MACIVLEERGKIESKDPALTRVSRLDRQYEDSIRFPLKRQMYQTAVYTVDWFTFCDETAHMNLLHPWFRREFVSHHISPANVFNYTSAYESYFY